LSGRTVFFAQECELFARLYAFGHDPLLQTLADGDHGADDAGVVRVRGEIAHERLIDSAADRKYVQRHDPPCALALARDQRCPLSVR
jgi:hypothetical protein